MGLKAGETECMIQELEVYKQHITELTKTSLTAFGLILNDAYNCPTISYRLWRLINANYRNRQAILKKTSEKLQERYNTADHFMHVNVIKVKYRATASPT